MRTAQLITALAALAILPVGARGQERPALEPGDRVRVTAPAMGLHGTEGTIAAIQSAQRFLRLETRDSVVVVPIDSHRGPGDPGGQPGRRTPRG